MASGKTPNGNGSRPKAASFGQSGDGTDPGAGSSDEILPGPGDSTNPNATSGRAQWKVVVITGPSADKEFPLEADEVTLGRGTDNGISIPDVSVSRHHVRLERDGDAFAVVDLKSGNGTKVNGAREDRMVLRHGDEITLGDTMFQVWNLAEVPPPRYRGAPSLVPSGKGAAGKAAASRPSVPSGATEIRAAVPATSAVTDTAPSSSPVPPPPPPPPKAKKQGGGGGGGGRMGIYAILLVLILAFLGIAKYLKDTGRLDHGLFPRGGDTQVLSATLIERARQKARDRQWTEALTMLVHEGPAKADETVSKWTDGVRFEATAQAAFQKAQASLQHGDYKGALDVARAIAPEADFGEDARVKIIDQMPEILANALVDARAAFRGGDKEKCKDIVGRVLLVSPTNADALTVLQECNYTAPPPPPPRDAGHEPEVDAGPIRPPYPCFGPAWTAYASGDFAGVVRYTSGDKIMPDCPDFGSKVREIQEHQQKGNELAQNKHIPEAAKEYEQAMKLDLSVATGQSGAPARPTKPGTEVKEAYSRMEYLLALDAKGDEQLPNRTKHLRAAWKANAENELAKKELDKAYARAHEIFQEAYTQKDSDKETAIRLFRIVFQTLPDGDEKKAKAQLWIDKLVGPKK